VGRFILRRLTQSVFTVLGVMLLTFLLFRVMAGDVSADVLVRRAAADYASAILAMAKNIRHRRLRVCLGGGILERAPGRFLRLVAGLVAKKRSGVVVSRPALAPEHGAAIMAAFHAGMGPSERKTGPEAACRMIGR